MAFVAEGCREAPSVKMSATRAVFVNDAVVGELGSAVFIQRGQLAHGDVFQNHRQQVVGIRRTTGQVDDRLSGDNCVDPDCARGIRIGRGNPPPGSTGTHGDHRR
jgi:hypothetical protein